MGPGVDDIGVWACIRPDLCALRGFVRMTHALASGIRQPEWNGAVELCRLEYILARSLCGGGGEEWSRRQSRGAGVDQVVPGFPLD